MPFNILAEIMCLSQSRKFCYIVTEAVTMYILI